MHAVPQVNGLIMRAPEGGRLIGRTGRTTFEDATISRVVYDTPVAFLT